MISSTSVILVDDTFGAEEFSLWGDMTLTKNLKSFNPAFERWFIYQEAWMRRGIDTRNLDTTLARLGIGFRLTDHISITAGYGYAWQHTVGKVSIEDQRPRQQIIIQEKFANIDFSSRTRFEEIITNKVQTPVIRARERIKVAYPLLENIPVSFIVSEELFFRLNQASPLMHVGLEQNRYFAGFGYVISNNTNIEIGYLNQTLFMDSMLTDMAIKGSMINHALSLNIHFNFD